MLCVEYEKWNQTIHDLRRLAFTSEHERTRERFLALYEVAQWSNATRVAGLGQRDHQTVQEWVKRYNAGGPDALNYEHTGGPAPFLSLSAWKLFEPS